MEKHRGVRRRRKRAQQPDTASGDTRRRREQLEHERPKGDEKGKHNINNPLAFEFPCFIHEISLFRS